MNEIDFRAGVTGLIVAVVGWWVMAGDLALPSNSDEMIRQVIIAALGFLVAGALTHVIRCWREGRYDRRHD